MEEVRIELGKETFTTVKVSDKSIFDEYRHKDGKLYGTFEVTKERKGIFLVSPAPCEAVVNKKL